MVLEVEVKQAVAAQALGSLASLVGQVSSVGGPLASVWWRNVAYWVHGHKLRQVEQLPPVQQAQAKRVGLCTMQQHELWCRPYNMSGVSTSLKSCWTTRHVFSGLKPVVYYDRGILQYQFETYTAI